MAFGLHARGYQVTVYSDRSAGEIFNGRVLGTAFMYDRALRYERELGLNFWDHEMPWGEGLHLDFCLKPGKLVLTMEGKLAMRGQATDQRLKFSGWMQEFAGRGGRLVVRSVTAES